MNDRADQLLAAFLVSLDGWVAQLEEARRSEDQERQLDHFQVTLCQASHSLRMLLSRGARPGDTTSPGPERQRT